MSSRPASGGTARDHFLFDDDKFFNRFPINDIKKDTGFTGRSSRSVNKDPFNFEKKRPSSGSRFSEYLRNFTPGPKESGEDILQQLKEQLRKESDMFFHSQPDWDNDMHSRRAEDSDDWPPKGFEDMRPRHHAMFRMPPWMSEDDDVSNLASRMSQSPHFSSMGRRGGPWRERRNSGGSAMSGTSEDDATDGHNFERAFHTSSAPNAVRIPIRIEAEAPPGYETQQKTHPQQFEDKPQGQNLPQASYDSQPPTGNFQKQPQYASRTNPAIDSLKQEDLSRNTRCSSAPPDMSDPSHGGQRFVSKASFPQPTNEKPFSPNPDFNNVAKPFVPSHKMQDNTPTIQEEVAHQPYYQQSNEKLPQQQNPQEQQFSQPQQQHEQETQHYSQNYPHPQQQPQQQQPQNWDNTGHKSSVVRNIPIIFEGKKTNDQTSSTPGRSPPQPQFQQQQEAPNRSQWESPFHGSHFGFGPSHGFPDDPFFSFPGGSSSGPAFYQQQQQQPQAPPQQQQPPHPASQPQYQQPQYSHSSNSQPQQPQPQAQPPQPQQPQPKEKSPQPQQQPKDVKMDKIATVRGFVTELQERVDKFEGNEKNKEFLYLDEMLTRSLIQLDNIDPDGRDDVRQVRRTLIKDINKTISSLEQKLKVPSGDLGKQELPQMEIQNAVNLTNEAQSQGNTSQEEKTPDPKLTPSVDTKEEVFNTETPKSQELKHETKTPPEQQPATETQPQQEKMEVEEESKEEKKETEDCEKKPNEKDAS